jgi:hypothetical protein
LTADGGAPDGSPQDAGSRDAATPDATALPDAGTGWHLPAYAYRRVLTVTAELPADLADFTVAVALREGVFDFSTLRDDGRDVAFVGEDGSTLPFERAVDPIPFLTFWVRLPDLRGPPEASLFTMYYGNPAAPDLSDAAAAWGPHFAAVFHMGSAGDSTSHDNSGEAQGVAWTPGRVGRAGDFLGARMVVRGHPSLDGLFAQGGTVTAWAKPRTWGEGQKGRILDRMGRTDLGWALYLRGDGHPATLAFARCQGTGFSVWDGPTDATPLGRWSHVAVVLDDRDLATGPRLYVDGLDRPALRTSSGSGAAAPDTSLDLLVGAGDSTGYRTFDGLLDEIRVVRGAQTGAWVLAEFLSTGGGLLRLGDQETR